MTVTDCPLIGYFDVQRFKQFNPSDCANWYLVPSDIGKKKVAMYPCLGRRHVNYLGMNRLIFETEPRLIEKSVNYTYVVSSGNVYRVDHFFNQLRIGTLNTLAGNVYFTYLTSGSVTFAVFTDGQKIYVYREDTGTFSIVTDINAPSLPTYIATFGNRIIVSQAESSQANLSLINLGGASFDPATCFQTAGSAVFLNETGVIRQMAVLKNTLYIFTAYTTGIWSNIQSNILEANGSYTTFPWKKNTSYEWDYGISDPNTLDVDFEMLVFEARNRNGLTQFMYSTGGGANPKKISTKAIDVLLQRIANVQQNTPLTPLPAYGFLYEYEDTIFYRFSIGTYVGYQVLDQINTSRCIEFNFDTQTWHRVIEANGERCRVQQHVFFGNRHLVSVQGDSTVYELSGQYYNNEITNPAETNNQAPDYYLQLPFRYERVTPIIVAGLIDVLKGTPFYAEFITDYVEIDFVFGESPFIENSGNFENAVFIVDENLDTNGNPIYMVSEDNPDQFIIAEQGNYPVILEPTFFNWYKPSIELLFSDDGGISYTSADVRLFSQIGQYQWRMRWYELGISRNRVYKLVCVSPVPIVVLGAVHDVRRASGGAA